MAGELVLVTGGSGHLGFRVIVTALESGYRVRAPVRSNSKITTIKSAPSIRKYLDKIDFIIVPDILKDGSYEEAVKGVTYVIHSASPLAIETTDYERDVINPAVKAKSTFPPPKGPFGHHFQAYCASKALAWHASNDFVASHKPAFDIISIFPTFFIGKNELITSLKDILAGTNGFAIGPVFGKISPNPLPGTTVHVDDIAKIEIFSLSTEIEGNQGFILSSHGQEGTTWEDSIEIVKKNFPESVGKGLFKLDGMQGTKKLKIDSARTEETFGFKLASYEEQVKSVIGHYIELAS